MKTPHKQTHAHTEEKKNKKKKNKYISGRGAGQEREVFWITKLLYDPPVRAVCEDKQQCCR